MSENVIVFICVLVFLIGGFCGGIIGYTIGNHDMRHEAIAQNAATWKEVTHPSANGGLEKIYEFSWGQN